HSDHRDQRAREHRRSEHHRVLCARGVAAGGVLGFSRRRDHARRSCLEERRSGGESCVQRGRVRLDREGGSLWSCLGMVDRFANGLVIGGSSLPLSLDGVSATVNGVSAPLYSISPGKLRLQIPYETRLGNAVLGVNNNGRVAYSLLAMSVASPAIFTDPTGYM